MSLRIALRNLGRNRARSASAGLVVCVAVAALVFADAWARGIGAAIRDYAAASRLGAAQVHARGALDVLDAAPLDRNVVVDDVTAALRGVAGVRGVAPRVRFLGTGSDGNDETMIMGLGVDPAAEARACPRFLADEMQAGRALQPGDDDVVVVGAQLARALRLAPGSAMVLEARDVRGRQNAIDVEVVGIASSSLPDEAKWLVIAPLQSVQRLVGLEGRATSIVLGGDADQADAIADAARTALASTPSEGSTGASLEVRTWREVGAYFAQASQTFAFAERFLMGVLALLVVAVVLNTALVVGNERTQEIGTMTALGAGTRIVRSLLVLEAALLGAGAAAAGGVVGGLISLAAAAQGVPFHPPNQPAVLVRPEPELWFVAAAAMGAVVVCALGTLLPAWLASRVPPAEALRAGAGP